MRLVSFSVVLVILILSMFQGMQSPHNRVSAQAEATEIPSALQTPILLYIDQSEIYGTDITANSSFFITGASYEFGDLPSDSLFAETTNALNFSVPLTDMILWHYRIGVFSDDLSSFIYTESNVATGEFNLILWNTQTQTAEYLVTHESFDKQIPLFPIGWIDNHTVLVGERLELGFYTALYRLDTQTGALSLITEITPAFLVKLSPDGQYVAVQAVEDEISVLDISKYSWMHYEFADRPIALLGWSAQTDLSSLPSLIAVDNAPIALQSTERFLYWPTTDTRNITRGYFTSPYLHNGIDINNNTASFDVRTAANAVVSFAGSSEAWSLHGQDCINAGGVDNGTAWLIILDHPNGNNTVYLTNGAV